MVDMVLAMPDMDMELTHMPMVDTDTHMPTELTTERDLLMLMLSQRLRLMLSMEPTHMLELMELTHMPMVDTDTHMPTELTMERDLLMLSQRLRLMLSMEVMDMVDMVLAMPDMDMELTHMLMVVMDTHMPMESKL